MSFLTPLYLIGALAVAAPILFHLIRRTTKSESPFSSLLFLTPSPPKLTRRSRIDQWVLLVLRSAVLLLLAAAFARPFLRKTANMNLGDDQRKRVAVLIDTSASMRRGDLWSKAKVQARRLVESCGPEDQLAVFAFDAGLRPLLSFDGSASLDPSQRKIAALAEIERLAPTWASTRLGLALVEAVGAIEDVGDADSKSSKSARRIVLVSDLQQGSRLEELGNFEWPSDVELELETVSVAGSNAGLELLADAEVEQSRVKEEGLRVRVSNDSASKQESFKLSWQGSEAAPVSVYVPPGESRVVRVARPKGRRPARLLELAGDSFGFDNSAYAAEVLKQARTVLYIGGDAADDPQGLLYYLSRAFDETGERSMKVQSRAPTARVSEEALHSAALVVLAGETSAENASSLRRFAEGGGGILFVAKSAGNPATLAAIVEKPAGAMTEAPVKGDVMFGEIDFSHPLFAAFAGAQFHDFTKIHVWKYRKLSEALMDDCRVLVRFENGDPAMIEKAVGKGRVVVLTSSWAPVDGQLALSSKFVPLLYALADDRSSGGPAATKVLVGEPAVLPEGSLAVHTPSGSTLPVVSGATKFSGTDAPGVYTIDSAKGPREFAVNLDPSESKTAPLEVEDLESLGCRLASSESKLAAEREAKRQLQNAELEGRQKLWRPLVLAAIALLIVETWLGGRLSRSRRFNVEAATT